MTISLLFGNKTIGSIPYASVAAFRLLCEEMGLKTKVNISNRELAIYSSLKGKTIVLEYEKNQDRGIHQEILSKTRTLLLQSGANIIINERLTTVDEGDFSIQLSVDSKVNNKLMIMHNLYFPNQEVKFTLEKELIRFNIVHEFKRMPNQVPFPQLIIKGIDSYVKEEEVVHQLSLSLASAILYFFLHRHPFSLLTCLPMELFNIQPMNESLTKQTNEKVNTKKFKQEDKAEKRINGFTPLQSKPSAEVFFNYTVYPFDKEEERLLTLGDLYIKNTGNINLYNPLICIKADPIEYVNFRGQIVPPEMAEALSVQGENEMTGWKYLDEDWFEKAKERGEFWIAPIKRIMIPPNESQVLRNFQLTLKKPDKKKQILIDGIVYFEDLQLHFRSNNRMTFSFKM
ncbi:hypothetical protein [Bacillus sp. FJAT-47783]|uniref:hypothetical protein n=1 Tax=Bacillus sp. FJAT-47783 TaxID=2922712 RepID=UPI001FAC0851|nr:hypothetical protein [Bacillus sp. FJAT-47783]